MFAIQRILYLVLFYGLYVGISLAQGGAPATSQKSLGDIAREYRKNARSRQQSPAQSTDLDLAQSFKEAANIADAQERASSTKEYFANTLLPYYAQKYAAVLQSCFAKTPSPDATQFSFVAAIRTDGQVARIYNDQTTNIFQCMRTTLESDSFPAPPVSPYYLHIDMRFTDTDADISKPHADQKAPPLVLEPNKYSYTFGVPKGWDFRFDQAEEHGARIVFFPKGLSFDQATSIIYVTEPCRANCAGTRAQAITRAITDAKNDSPKLTVDVASPLTIKQGGNAEVRILTGARDTRQAKEALAFIEHNEAIILVVLTTMDVKTWSKDYEVLREIVSGHKFFTCNTPDLAQPCRQ